MTIETLFLLSSGLFLGWSLGANDAGNVFGTAVGSRMIRFSTAVVVCSIFMVLGAVWSGEGVSRGLVELSSVSVLGGAFMVALAAAIAVFLMIRTGIQVSTTQALIGSLLGWNAFAGVATDITVFLQVVSTWVLGPLLAAAMAMAMMRTRRCCQSCRCVRRACVSWRASWMSRHERLVRRGRRVL